MSDAQNKSAPSAPLQEGDAMGDDADQQDLTIYVQNLLTQMQSRFQQMSEAIITRIDDMGNRIDGLEKSIGDLMNQAGVEEMEPRATAGSGDRLEESVRPEDGNLGTTN